MKKAISLAFLCICVFIIYQFGVNFIKTTHTVSYNIRNEKDFMVVETFKNKSYFFEITTDEYKFYYKEDNLFNKMKNVIKNIAWKEENGMLCIYPAYSKQTSAIMCSDKKTMYTYNSVKNRALVSSFYNELKNQNYTFKFDEEFDNTLEEKDRVSYYQENFNNDENLTLWNYQGFTIFNKQRSLNVYSIDFDRYENTISTLISKYYITPIYKDNKLFEFSKVLIYDILTNKQEELSLGVTMSNYTYVNGVVANKLYLVDPNNIVQITIDPKNKIVETVGNKEKNGVYYDGKFQERNIYDFVNTKITFKIDDTKLREKYNYNLVLENEDSYFFYDGNGLYQVYKDNLDVAILIVGNSNLKQIKLKNNTIYYLLEKTIYKYENNKLTKPLLIYDELLYNSSNMYDVYN